MSKLVTHPLTSQQLVNTRQAAPHALILSGPRGSGKLTLAQQLAEELLSLPPGGLGTYGYALQLQPADNGSIGIDAVREIEKFLSLKVPGKQAIQRVVIIEAAEGLTHEAQNALLKTLEEPPLDTVIILTAARPQALLPTIRSRARLLDVRRPERQAVEQHFTDSGHELQEVRRLYAMSGGLPGLMSALLEDAEHPLRAATETARQLLTQAPFERLRSVDVLARDRSLAMDVTFILQQMARVSLPTAGGAAAQRWQAVLKAAYHASEALDRNGQPKLVLTELMLQLG